MGSSDFVNHSYDYRPNWTTLSPVTYRYHYHHYHNHYYYYIILFCSFLLLLFLVFVVNFSLDPYFLDKCSQRSLSNFAWVLYCKPCPIAPSFLNHRKVGEGKVERHCKLQRAQFWCESLKDKAFPVWCCRYEWKMTIFWLLSYCCYRKLGDTCFIWLLWSLNIMTRRLLILLLLCVCFFTGLRPSLSKWKVYI